MKPEEPPPQHKIPELNRFERKLLGAVIFGALGVGALGLYSSYRSVSNAAQAWGFTTPWVLPVALDISIPVFSLAYLFLIRFDMALAWVRAVPWALTLVTVYLNVVSAGHNTAAQLGHGALPLLWVVCSEIAAHVYRVLIGAATGRRMERVRRSRWILAPVSTFLLWRRMVLWEVVSYRTGLALERERRMIRAHYRQEHGRGWRRKVTRQQLAALKLGELAPATAPETAPAKPLHVICTGVTGVLFLRRPVPLKTSAPSEPAGPVGARILDLATVLSGQHAPVVYFIRNGDRIKIGTTTSLRNRVRRLCLRVDDIALVLHGGQGYERQLHDRFATYRSGDTEWFELAGELAAFVAAERGETVVSAGGAALATAEASGATTATASGGISVQAEMALEELAAEESAGGSSDDAVALVGGELSGDSSPSGDSDAAEDDGAPTSATANNGGRRSAKKRIRRPMEEWVVLAGPIFHEEFKRRRRQPTGEEFAGAIERAGLGNVSESTAKNIRTAILNEEGKALASR